MKAGRQRGTDLLLAALRDRAALAQLSAEDWAHLLPAADGARLLPRLALDAERLRLASSLPDWVRDRLTSARVRGEAYRRDVSWEIDRVHRALLPIGVRPVFLKGAAYVAAGLPCGLGRVLADVDILVAEADLPRVEAALKHHGWVFAQLDAYDERYYRQWMHELPPMVHSERGTVLDVHHRILPRTGRIHPPTARLLEKAAIANGARVLSGSHMVLHSAAHLFQDGEVAGALRDVADIHDLLTDFGRTTSFWEDLAAEAAFLGLGRSLYYATRYAQQLLGTSLPDGFITTGRAWVPPAGVRAVMDALVNATLTGRSGAAPLALYIRAHWLKMPAGMLVKHLARKMSVPILPRRPR